MSHAFIRLAAALVVAAGTSAAFAEDLDFKGTAADGRPVKLGFSINASATPFLSETLTDGTLHNSFLLAANGVQGIGGAWRLDAGSDIGLYYGYDEFYVYGTAWGGPVVDAYLHPDGHSSLALEWSTGLECHGGCTRASKIHLDLSSSTGGLFTSAITSSVLQQYTSGSGVASWHEVYSNEWGVPMTRDTSLNFTLSAVPEPQAVMMALGGLVAVAGALRRRRA